MTAVFAKLVFPALALEVLEIPQDGVAAVVYAGQRVVAANTQALANGLYPGMTLSLAHSLCPSVHTQVP